MKRFYWMFLAAFLIAGTADRLSDVITWLFFSLFSALFSGLLAGLELGAVPAHLVAAIPRVLILAALMDVTLFLYAKYGEKMETPPKQFPLILTATVLSAALSHLGSLTVYYALQSIAPNAELFLLLVQLFVRAIVLAGSMEVVLRYLSQQRNRTAVFL